MTKFETIKELVTVRQAAEHYGLNVTRSNMCRCPFHSDHTPSMKIYDKNYHCFGCGAHGDVIDLTAHIFGTSQLEAAKRLNEDFCLRLDMDKPVSKREISIIRNRRKEAEDYAEWERNAWISLSEYYKLLCQWREEYAPASETDTPDERFIESLKNRDYIEYLCSIFISGSKEERTALREEVNNIERRMYEYRRSLITLVAGGLRSAGRTAVLQ